MDFRIAGPCRGVDADCAGLVIVGFAGKREVNVRRAVGAACREESGVFNVTLKEERLRAKHLDTVVTASLS